MTFQNILCAVDFSADSDQAIRTAAELSRRFDARVTLVHVCQPLSDLIPDGYMLYGVRQLDEMRAAFESQLANAKKAAEASGALSVSTKLLQGIPEFEIAHLAEMEKFDLVVMGTHGRTGLQRALLGSVAERVQRHAPCAVLTVRIPAVKADAKPSTSQ